MARQKEGEFELSKRRKIKQMRRKRTGGNKIELSNIDNFKNKVKEYTNFS